MKLQKRIQAKWNEKLIMDKGGPGRRAFIPEAAEVPEIQIPESWQRRNKAKLPEVSELELVRHVVRLSQMSHAIDVGPYPLGSCTMKYNPKINERIARFAGFSQLHPEVPDYAQQGTLKVTYLLQEALKELTGLSAFSVQTAGGAQGEYAGVLIMKAYHDSTGEKKDTIIVPDSAHGTNPASATMAGFKVSEVPSNDNGTVDIEALKGIINKKTAGIMLTNPNTLGIFETDIEEINQLIHEVNGLSYMDGANFNGIISLSKPSDMGFDIMHLNLHKTFTGPHGGGGPGSGPVGVRSDLSQFLPIPIAEYDKKEREYFWDVSHSETSIGRLHGYNGNFGINLRALAYIYRNGATGLRNVCTTAVLNANYLHNKIKHIKGLSIPRLKEGTPCKHEFVASAQRMVNETQVSALDIAKAMLDYGVHSPTIYFPLIIKEALMIEPTESETLQDLDNIYSVLKEISDNAYENKELVLNTPKNTSSGRVDEASLAKKPILSARMMQDSTE